MNGSVIDCRYLGNRWHFVRVRKDRKLPNSLRTISGNKFSRIKQLSRIFLKIEIIFFYLTRQIGEFEESCDPRNAAGFVEKG